MLTAIQTAISILLLIYLGAISRKLDILRKGDERVLSSYVYYFAIPSLLFINITQTDFSFDTIKYIIIAILPIFIFIILTISICFLLGVERETLYLLIVSSIFGSTVFFGIPFIIFAYPENGEKLAVLAASFMGVIGVSISITILEVYKLRELKIIVGLKNVARRLARNPIIISIILGIIASIIRFRYTNTSSHSSPYDR
ncbi:MAG: hypothetical protein DRN12_02915 [Thermoplasmata archaeon]|nr:MAG: hypothetical protein DRN12_02915 [Thermoplasmata archaeon]